MDEYQLEIAGIRRTLDKLREDEAEPELIEEYEVELRLLTALYKAAGAMMEAGERDQRLREALPELGFGDWNLPNVYSFVYDAATATDLGGRELAQLIDETDYARSLLVAVDLVP